MDAGVDKSINMGRKSSQLEYEKRIEDVIGQITKGVVRTKDLIHFITQKYTLSSEQSKKDVAEAKKRLAGISTEWEKIEMKGLAIQRYNYLFLKNINAHDFREARQVQSQLDKITGVESTEIKIDLPNRPIIEFARSKKNNTE